MNYREAWNKYYSVNHWYQSGKNTTWSFDKDEETSTFYLFFQGSYEKIDWIRDCFAWPKY